MNKGFAKYIDKKKALDYLHYPAPIAETLSNPELDSAAKVIRNLNNPKLLDDDFDVNAQNGTQNTENGIKKSPDGQSTAFAADTRRETAANVIDKNFICKTKCGKYTERSTKFLCEQERACSC